MNDQGSSSFAARWTAAQTATTQALVADQHGAEKEVGKSFPLLLHCIPGTLCNVPGSIVVKLEAEEAELSFPGPLSIPNKTLAVKSEALEADSADLTPELEDGEIPEGEVDGDYVETSEDDAPKPINMAMIKSASKRKSRPFAPPERHQKKKVKAVNPYVALLMKQTYRENTNGSRHTLSTRLALHGPDYYTSRGIPQPYTRSDLQDLKYLRELIAGRQTTSNRGMSTLYSTMRDRLADMAFYDNVSDNLIRASKLLDDGGLPDIFNGRGGAYPHDLVSDALAQYKKWAAGNYDPDLFRGIVYKDFTPAGTGAKSNKARSLEEGYAFKISSSYVGAGGLTNGQWWPMQICLVRDGAHGTLEGGISGERGGIAHSIVVSNSGYSNVDNGEQLEYCGTSGRNKTPTVSTKMLLESCSRGTPVRVIRSAAAKATKYLPAKGLRYDGLYDVTSYVVLDEDTAMHRFAIQRQAGQGPIRHAGDGARPNPRELHVYQRLRQNLGLPA